MLIDIRYRNKWTKYHIEPDLWGILAVVNDLYDRHPGKFGPPKTREALKQEIAAYLEKAPECFNDPAFYSYLAELFEKHHLQPLKDTSLALVGAWNGHYDWAEQTTLPAQPILDQFGTVHDISHKAKGEFLRTDNALRMVGGERVDYVMTGNVINAPDNKDNADTILACANLLKADGRVFHMLSYAECEYSGVIDDRVLHKLAGQKHLANIPNEPYGDKGRYGGTEMMVMGQLREVEHTPKTTADYRKNNPQSPTPRYVIEDRFYWEETVAPQIPKTLSGLGK